MKINSHFNHSKNISFGALSVSEDKATKQVIKSIKESHSKEVIDALNKGLNEIHELSNLKGVDVVLEGHASMPPSFHLNIGNHSLKLSPMVKEYVDNEAALKNVQTFIVNVKESLGNNIKKFI